VGGEDDLIAAIAGALPGALPGQVEVGIGDDAAVLAGGLLLAADMLVDGVHFDGGGRSGEWIGARAAGANLSDIAAMGGDPLCLTASLGLPDGFADVAGLARGLASYGVPLVGGDLSRAPALVVSVAVLGRAERPVLRSTAHAGDVLCVTGSLGGQAACGYSARVRPRLAEGRALAGSATAMIDLSDGIATDAARLAAASGLRARIVLACLPRAAGATVEQAAAGGEDFELLAALPPDRPLPDGVTPVGELVTGTGIELLEGSVREVALRGWDHFGG
jgi:thiamine-monophosphate kinase